LVVSGPAWAQSQDPPEPAQPVPTTETPGITPQEPRQTGEHIEAEQPSGDAEAGDVRFRQPLFRGVFGPPPDDGKAPRVANMTATVTGAYDHNTADDPAGVADPRLSESGFYAGVAANVDFVARGKRSSFTAAGNTAITRYEVVDGTQASYGIGLGFTSPIGRNTLHASQTVAYSPLFQLGLFAGLPPTGSTDVNLPGPSTNLDAAALSSMNYVTAVDFTHPLSRRSSIALVYDFQQNKYPDQTRYNLDDQRVGVRYLHTVSTYATLHLEYGYHTGHYAESLERNALRHSHDIIAGVDYARTLSFSQKTRFSFSTGSSLLVNGGRQLGPASESEGNRLYVNGNASLIHNMGRTWFALATYSRAVRFQDGFRLPFLDNSTTASVSGYVGPRVTLSTNASYSGGTVGTSGIANGYSSYAVSTFAQFALGRRWAIFSQAMYYHYEFERGVVLPEGLPPALDRTGVRIGLTTWLPLQHGKD
jgi:hypothetical protein